MSVYTNLISAAQLQADLPTITVLDCRSQLGDPQWGPAQYREQHISGALYAHLDTDLADPPDHRGRHPLPERQRFIACVENWGITPQTQVVCYDDAGGAYAARAWWMLRWLGHKAVAVLDGGMGSWQGPWASGPQPNVTPTRYESGTPLTRQIDVATLLAQLDSAQAPYLLDARARVRWAGIQEPIDAVAGHIPGAHCHPFQDNLDPQGHFLDAATLRAQLPAVDQPVVCYCGSGVTAAHNILAMHIAGLPEPQLYADSWSGWITDPQRPVETGH